MALSMKFYEGVSHLFLLVGRNEIEMKGRPSMFRRLRIAKIGGWIY